MKKNKKRAFALVIVCFLFAVYSIPVFSGNAIIVDGDRTVVPKNFGNSIFFYVDGVFTSDKYHPIPKDIAYPFYLTRRQWVTPYTDELEDFDAFCALLLHSLGVDVQISDVDQYADLASAFFDSADKNVISEFIKLISSEWLLNGSVDNVYYLGFSREFCLKVENSLSLYFDRCGSSMPEFDFFIVDDFDSEWWVSFEANVLKVGPIRSWNVGVFVDKYEYGLYLKDFSIISYSAYAESKIVSFQTLVDSFLGAIDITILTSWLPPVISSVYIIAFSSFFGLIAVMVVLKFVHG